MGPFTKLLNVAVSVVHVPVSIVKDIVTIGGIATEQENTYTEEALRRVAYELDTLIESEDDE